MQCPSLRSRSSARRPRSPARSATSPIHGTASRSARTTWPSSRPRSAKTYDGSLACALMRQRGHRLGLQVLASLSQLSKHLTTKCPAKAEADRHYEVYTGSGGLAYTFLRLYQQSALLAKQGDVKDKVAVASFRIKSSSRSNRCLLAQGFAEFAQSCLQHSADYIRCSLSRLKKYDFSCAAHPTFHADGCPCAWHRDRDRPDYTFITGALACCWLYCRYCHLLHPPSQIRVPCLVHCIRSQVLLACLRWRLWRITCSCSAPAALRSTPRRVLACACLSACVKGCG